MPTELPGFDPSNASALAFLPEWLNPEGIISALGPFALIGVCLIIFAECGLLFGFFLPGDSLLFGTGMFTATGAIAAPLWLVCLLLVVFACAGNVTGYWIGHKAGPALFNKPGSKLLKREHVDKTHDFFERYGGRAIILARFVPIVRTFITAVAGVAGMDRKKFFGYSAIGAVVWAAGLTVVGFFLGNVPWIKNNIEMMAVIIVGVSTLPVAVEYLRNRHARTKTAHA